MIYLNSSVKNYLNDLKKAIPAPGGGSASALCGSIGASLILMSIEYTIKSRSKCMCHLPILKKNLKLIKALTKKLDLIIDKDIRVYKNLRDVMALPKEQKKRSGLMVKALKASMDVPMDACILIGEIFKRTEEIYEVINKPILSDIGCGIEMLNSAFNSSKVNVLINLKFTVDKGINKKTTETLNSIEKNNLRIYKKIKSFVNDYLVK